MNLEKRGSGCWYGGKRKRMSSLLRIKSWRAEEEEDVINGFVASSATTDECVPVDVTTAAVVALLPSN